MTHTGSKKDKDMSTLLSTGVWENHESPPDNLPEGMMASRGLHGATGQRGADGVTGVQGLQGATGAKGVDGKDGIHGAQGINRQTYSKKGRNICRR